MGTPKVIVVGCGIVGALVAYELSAQLAADIVVLDKQFPAQGSTGAALGVLMGAISGRVKGRTWRLREASIRRYPALISELAKQGYSVPFNSQGIVSLCYDEAQLPRWETLKDKRALQGWPLEIWTPEELKDRCEQVSLGGTSPKNPSVKAAIYSPADRQVHPVDLTNALVAIAKKRGVIFHHNTEVIKLDTSAQHCPSLQTSKGTFAADWIILTAGLGSAVLTQSSHEPLELMPVLGQAIEIQLPKAVGKEDFQPVINSHDVQFVPLGKGRYWLGATVEFPPEDWVKTDSLVAEAKGLTTLKSEAEKFIKELSFQADSSAQPGHSEIHQAKILKTWSGIRPRPVGQPAPVIKPLAGTDNVILATGHYRNGVLLAPATAQQVCDLLKQESAFSA